MKALKIAAVAATLVGSMSAQAAYTPITDKVFHACVKVTHKLGNCSFAPSKIVWANNAPNNAVSTTHAKLNLDGASPDTTFKVKVSNGTYAGGRQLCKGHVNTNHGSQSLPCPSGDTIEYDLIRPGTANTSWAAMDAGLYSFTTDGNGDASVEIKGVLKEDTANKPAGVYGDTIRLWIGY